MTIISTFPLLASAWAEGLMSNERLGAMGLGGGKSSQGTWEMYGISSLAWCFTSIDTQCTASSKADAQMKLLNQQ